MKKQESIQAFDLHTVLHELKHVLPAQAPLKDFIHHNTLHAFQHLPFHKAIHEASVKFGYKTSLSVREYQDLYRRGLIKDRITDNVLKRDMPESEAFVWKRKLLAENYEELAMGRIGMLRNLWKTKGHIDLNTIIHPVLFRVIGSYLDQGVSVWNFPVRNKGFMASVRKMEKSSFSSFFKCKSTKKLLIEHETLSMEMLLKEVVSDPKLFEQYLYDQQFAHPGWSGMVSAIEDMPSTLIDRRKISLHDFIVFELLLELDALNYRFGDRRKPLSEYIVESIPSIKDEVPYTKKAEVLHLWQEAYEWSFYDTVLSAVQNQKPEEEEKKVEKSFQAVFCIDDRECSLRRYLEGEDKSCETFGTAGFFGVEFYYQPIGGKHLTKLCPAPVTPNYLIKEVEGKSSYKQDLHLSKHVHSPFFGWIISQTLGFWSALKLFYNIFKPSMSPATASSLKHMDRFSKLTVENKHPEHIEKDLQVGFTVEEMAVRVETQLKSIGLTENFAPVVYIVGHGASSVNNPHYAAYDCGACSGRAGSVNARVFSQMANHEAVRLLLHERGIRIPDQTQFIGALHDTTRDEIVFYDENLLSASNANLHEKNRSVFDRALKLNAKERSRRFEYVKTSRSTDKVYKQVQRRSVSLFEPRPELNHATNALCIVGRRALSKHIFLDRRSFLNSYDYRTDPEGNYLFGILRAVAPVCGGINLEYYFSRVDNLQLGAGTKLPHNVMGLYGVANGVDGDLRPGLPSQMIEVHDPLRLLVIIEHFPEVVAQAIRKDEKTYEWFKNSWVNMVAVHPETKKCYVFRDEKFDIYQPLTENINRIDESEKYIESSHDNLEVALCD